MPGRYLVVVMPKMHCDLYEFMLAREEQQQPVSEAETRIIAQQLAGVLAHIHARGFVHGETEPVAARQNIA